MEESIVCKLPDSHWVWESSAWETYSPASPTETVVPCQDDAGICELAVSWSFCPNGNSIKNTSAAIRTTKATTIKITRFK